MVAARTTLTVIPYERRYRAQVLDLIEYSYQRHMHLDWYEPDLWLDLAEETTHLAFKGTQLMGMMAASAPIQGSSWLRMIALSASADEAETLQQLWRVTAATLRAAGTSTVWVLLVEPWLGQHMPLLEMTQTELLVTLRREGATMPVYPRAQHVNIEPATLLDLPAMIEIDHAAFMPPYPMTPQEMRRAHRFAEQSRVARAENGEILGYQISNRHTEQGHLARLAVSPHAQQHGIGSALVQDMLYHFHRRGINYVSVNTQLSNTRSLHLYTACGFSRSGYDIPIYQALLE